VAWSKASEGGGVIRNAPPKPAKGSALMDRRQKRAEIKAHEATEKAKVVKRDGLTWTTRGWAGTTGSARRPTG
jgi:hypothetical protein